MGDRTFFHLVSACLFAAAAAKSPQASAQTSTQPSAPDYAQPAPAYAQPAPAYAQPAPAYAQPAPAYAQPAPGYAQPAPGYAQPAPAPAAPERLIPPSSVRLDMWSLILQGRLALELETAPLDWLSIEMVPIFVLAAQPIGSRLLFDKYDQIYQGAAGVGPLAGASLGVAFWLDGKPLRGTAVRTGLTFYGFEYEARDTDGETRLDRVVDNQRRLTLLLADSRRWGHFTLSTAFGVEYELTDQRRCFEEMSNSATTTGCRVNELQLATSPPSPGGVTFDNVHGFLHPLYLTARLSLGVVF